MDRPSLTFAANLSGLAADKRYYLRAFAKNAHGTALSSPKRFRTLPAEATSPAIAGAVHQGNGWYESAWFGTFYQAPNGWLLHHTLGWWYYFGRRNGNRVFYDYDNKVMRYR